MKNIEKLLKAGEISQIITILLMLSAVIVQIFCEQLVVYCMLSAIVLLLTLFLIFIDIKIKNGLGIMVHLAWLLIWGYLFVDSFINLMS